MANIRGKVGNDTLKGVLDEWNEIWGHSGDDDIAGGRFEDVIRGGKGNDSLWGDRGGDHLLGNTGNDKLWGSIGDDLVQAGQGDDWASGGKDNDTVAGGKGDDHLLGFSGDDLVLGGTGNDLLEGNSGNDVLVGGAGNDVVRAGSGDDLVVAGSGNDVYSGGSGFDTLDFSAMSGRLTIDLGKHTGSIGSGKAFSDFTVSGFEVVLGSDTGNVMTGDRNATHFVGGDSADWFRGKLGSDTMTGGDGNDTFAYLKKDLDDGSVDRITDFTVGADRLDMADFLKGRASYDEAVKLDVRGDDTVVMGLVKGAWMDVVVLDNVHVGSIADLGLLAA